ncbi:MAG: hypothetical protein L3J28_06185 [Candidatus Polarisedimenticolaceae bacterium]|nr:hypothetical protein [Candidatus Polarisedimenticolaceae bacterium]
MNRLKQPLWVALLLLISVVDLPESQARMMGGGMGGGMMAIFDGYPTEEACRNCHEDLENFPMLEMVNPDRHHTLVGTPIPYLEQSKAPDAPGGTPGDPYGCMACHEYVWDIMQMAYVIKPFSDCLQCHPVSVVTGSPMTRGNVHHQTETFLQRNCHVCHG